MKRFLVPLAVAALVASACSNAEKPAIIPQPAEIKMNCGSLTLQDGWAVLSLKPYGADIDADRLESIREYAETFIADRTGLEMGNGEGGRIFIYLDPESELPEEGYTLTVSKHGVTIIAPQTAGLFYGLQTLRQLLPLEKGPARLPYLAIKDYPRFAWRGLHLDVSRHFFNVEQVKRFLDRMAMYKFNRFHWHLVDDQGWRIEIKSHPELTAKGAWRKSVGFVENQQKGLNVDDGKPYGGFFTQDEIRDVVAYAASLGITVIPEIDLPGHSKAAIHAIPQIYCFPKKRLEVWTEGGVSEGVVCAGKEITFKVLEDVLSEVIDLFPAEYIHLGGDEAPKDGWKHCPDCQARIRKEGLKDEHELQGYFMKRLEKFVNSKGKKMIGWDEIMEGGLSETATVMSWRGVLPGIEAAEGGNDVIMTPGDYVYLNHPQSINPVTQATGGLLSLKTVYSFDPAPATMSAEGAAHILGVQGCQWCENTPDDRILYYKEYPRALAVAEIGWTEQAQRDWDCFYDRLQKHLPHLEYYGIGYGAPCYDVKIELAPDRKGRPCVGFSSEVCGNIYYTLDGSEPTESSAVFNKPIPVTEDCTVRAGMFRPDGSAGRVATQEIHFHKALCKKVTYAIPYSTKHTGGGDWAMTDGMLGKWQGYEKSDADFTIDLGSVQPVQNISSCWKYDFGNWILKPTEITCLVSTDGKNFEEVSCTKFTNSPDDSKIGLLGVQTPLDGRKIRYIQIKAKSEKTNPSWHSSAGANCWIFVDEITVD